MCCSEDCKWVFRMGCAMLCMCCGSPAERKHSAKSAPKSTKNVSGSTRKPPRAPTKQTIIFVLQCFGVPRPNHTYDFDPFWLQNWWKTRSKKWSKNGSHPKLHFSIFFGFSRVARAILIDFGPQNGSQEGPGATFSRASPARGFQLDFSSSFR